MPDPMLALARLCATCEHQHAGVMTTLTQYPACDVCGCSTFRLHPDEIAAADADEAAESLHHPHGRILGADMARGLTGALHRLDADHADRWDVPPTVGCFYAAHAGGSIEAPPGLEGAVMVAFVAAALDLRYGKLLQLSGYNPNQFVPLLADMAEQRPSYFDSYLRNAGDIDPAVPVLAWWVVFEAWERGTPGDDMSVSVADRPELATDEVRTIVCIDVDERIHRIVRIRRAGTVATATDPWPVFAAHAAAEPAAGPAEAEPEIPPMLTGLLRLVRHSRVQTLARRALYDSADGDSPDGRPG